MLSRPCFHNTSRISTMKYRISLAIAAACAFLALLAAQAAPPQTPAIVQSVATSAAQSSVASKTAKFGTVPAAASSVAKALEAHDLAGAQKLVGKPGAFQGTVTQAYSPHNHSIVILDFDKQYKTALTATLLPADFAKFPDLATLLGKHVLITGTVSAPKGKPQIALTLPAQVEVIR